MNFNLENKRGNLFVEASVVLPIIILSLLSIIFIIIFIMNGVIEQGKVNIKALQISGVESNTFSINGEPKYKNYEKKKNSLMIDYVVLKSNLSKKRKFLLGRNMRKRLKSRAYIINEKKIIKAKGIVNISI